MRRKIAIELSVVFVLFVAAGFLWFLPATTALLRGDITTSIGDGTDSITLPWQYYAVVDTLHDAPSRLLFGGIYTDQVTAPEGQALFMAYGERALVIAFAPFLKVELMPTAIVWAYVVLSGLAMYGCGRLLGWSRTLSFALALAWAICPFTRARSVVHLTMVGVFFAPMVIAGLRVAAGSPAKLGWSSRKDLVVAAVLFFGAVFAAHYFLLMVIGFSPAFIALFVAFLPRGASRLRSIGRLVVAALPALALLAWTRVMPAGPNDARRMAAAPQDAAEVQKQANNFLHWYGAHGSQYLAGDVRFGDRDVLPWRRAITAEIRAHPDNPHEQTNGIRWTVLAASAALVVVVSNRRLRRVLTEDDRRLAIFALAVGLAAFLLSFSPQGIRSYDVELGPSRLFARVFPQFRVPNRMGVLAHFSALLATGTLVAALARRTRPRVKEAIGAGLVALVLVEYLPLHPVLTTAIPSAWSELQPKSGPCGAGLQVPYASWEANEPRYYRAQSEVRGTSCKIIHGGYLTPQDERMRASLSKLAFTPADRERSVAFARCTHASWAQFSSDTPDEFKRAYCADLGWDSCGRTLAGARRRSRIRAARSNASLRDVLGVGA